MKYRVAIVVHGRFCAIDMAKGLLARGHDIHLFTNYPRWAVARFGFPPKRVTSHVVHGVATRFFNAVQRKLGGSHPEAWLHENFGRWAARLVPRENWDAVLCFSGVAEELLGALKSTTSQRWLVRGSSHIRAQAELLEAEERRAGVPIDRPSAWMIQREEREYARADTIVTLSSFAARTFNGTGHEDKVVMVPLGVDVSGFRPTTANIEAHRQRILSGARLRVLFVGTKSYRKGLLDFAQIARTLAARFTFRSVGPEEPQARALLNKLRTQVELVPSMPEAQLRDAYEWGDIFVFPTIEDGFAVVLTQAYAAGLPILATTNCGAPDFVRDMETGWILPIRAPERFIQRLEWCDQHRAALADTVTRITHKFHPRTWDDVAGDLELFIEQRRSQSAPAVGVLS